MAQDQRARRVRQSNEVAGITKLHLPAARQAIVPLHAYLRQCILDGTLVPGTKLSQVTLAEQLGVSRTPLREVLRMLQEEGLVQTEPNQRTRVAGLDPAELDDMYASRILLETLALSMTVGSFGTSQHREARRLLAAMRRSAKQEDVAAWFPEHTRFHQLLSAGAQESMRRQLGNLADRSIRYIRIYQLAQPLNWHTEGDREHVRILQALRDDDAPGAIVELAHHLSRTALRVLADCTPDYEPVAVPHALGLLTAGPLGVASGLSAAG